jgi:hypothetical protein
MRTEEDHLRAGAGGRHRLIGSLTPVVLSKRTSQNGLPWFRQCVALHDQIRIRASDHDDARSFFRYW